MKKFISYCQTFLLMIVFNTQGGAEPDRRATRYLDPIRFFADNVLAHGRDVYGNPTPLFVDGIQTQTLKPAKWKSEGGDSWIISNFASQQSLMRLLDGLTAVTHDETYRQAAKAATAYALENLRAENGLLYWGGHMAWDLEKDRPMGHRSDKQVHELKYHQPYFELMWRVNPKATAEMMQMIWAAHILDWASLSYNRHALFTQSYHPHWHQIFLKDIEVPLEARKKVRAFANVVPPLLRSGVLLSLLSGREEALESSRNLLFRWQQNRHPETGLSGGELSYGVTDRAQLALVHVHPQICEAKIVASGHQTSRYHSLPLAQMQAAKMLLKAGKNFKRYAFEMISWAADDLKTYARECYDPIKGVFVAKMTDGTPIQWQKAKSGYYSPASFKPRKPDSRLYWGFALAYGLTHDPEHWSMLRKLGIEMNIGDIGSPDGQDRNLIAQTLSKDWRMIYALLELEKITRDPCFLDLACLIADNIVAMQTATGLYPRAGKHYARTGDQKPLALLHLVAALTHQTTLLPQPVMDHAFYHAVYHGATGDQQKVKDKRTVDNLIFY